ncbi:MULTISPECIES: alpha/beta hydrolase [unclassified Polaribacter]|uniref:alpha/beta hydrolase n=1 Tax=unclassified Polaribacter TaxID=196858 RepID=UPI0011BD7365|nr:MULTISPECIES: alpha/beta hydrolase [unclassified Polaribacter]TXD53153.1 alpha/beta hydrolase [Polaribacter sp. IC063]TXD61273.1 alpha/beta hydrolase [Polaribacter sp. IC066]
MKQLKVIFLFFSICCFSQNYSKEIIPLYKDGNVPFNKENIVLEEILGEEGMRYSQISKPELYIFKNDSLKKNGASLLIIPGGGYARVVVGKNNGEGNAKHFLKMGFNVVAILKYRLPDARIVNSQEKVPLCDAQKALSIMHQNSTNWSVNENKIAVIGSSAGGHLAASLANLTDVILAPDVKPKELKHAVSILIYPVITFDSPFVHKGSVKNLLGSKQENKSLLNYYSQEHQVSKNTPPTFIVHAKDDTGVVPQNSELYSDSLKKNDVNYKYVELEKGGHGFGLNFKKTGVDWTIALEEWLQKETALFTE